MKYDQFLALVQERMNLESRTHAAAITRATLQTLAERVEGDEANNFAAQLPPELKEYMLRPPGSPADPFPLDEFVRRVSDRANIDGDEAVREARSVLRSLAESVTEGDVNHLWAQLPGEYLSLFEPPRPGATNSANTRAP